MRIRSSFLRVLPATFLAGVLFGVAVSSIGAAFKGSTVFQDVPSDNFADEAIGEMYQLGIIKGLDSAHFGPDQPLTRAQAAVLFKRLRDEIKGIASSSSSRSVSSSSASTSSSSSSSSSSSVAGDGGVVRFDSTGYAVEKNISTGKVQVIIVRTNGNQGGGTIDYVFSGGTAIAGKDYQPLSGTLTFNSRETSKKLDIQILNNTSSTGDKTVTLTIKNPTGVLALGTPNSAVLTIDDPNVSSSSSASSAATTISLSASAYGTAENGGTVTITVNRTGVVTAAMSVGYATGNGTASSGGDYTSVNGTLSFAAGETSKTFTVAVADNNTVDGNRIFTVTLSSPAGGAALGVASAPVTINDEEIVPVASGSLKFNAQQYSVTRSQGTATITVNHVLGVGAAAVTYATSNGSAQAGRDYTDTSGTLTYAVGETSKTFTVPILNPSTTLSGELTFTLTLSSPTNGVTLMDPSITTIIIYQ